MRTVLLFLLFLLTPLAALAQENDDAGFLARLIQNNLSDAGREVRIHGFEGALSSRATIERLTIADAEGIWFTAEDLVLDWNRAALLRRRIEVKELTASLIRIDRLPVQDPGLDLPAPEATPFSLPELPVAINIEQLVAGRIELGEPILGEKMALSLTGQVTLQGGEGEAEIAAQRIDGSAGHFTIDGSYSNETRVLGLDVELVEEEGGIVARLLDLPGNPSVRLTLDGTAPIDNYEAELTLATDGQERLSGTFMLASEQAEPEASGAPLPDPTRRFALNVSGDVTPLFAPDYADFFGPNVRLEAEGIRRPDGSLRISDFHLGTLALELSGTVELGPGGWPQRLDIQGTLGTEDDRVLLPLPGPRTYVDGATLSVSYDAAQDNRWQGVFEIDGLERPGLYIPQLTLDGGGTIVPGAGEAQGRATADLSYRATGVRLDDAALAEALGADFSGMSRILITEGAPLEIEELTLEGPGLALEARATVGGVEGGLRTDVTATASVEDLDRFSTLAGRELGGAAEFSITGDIGLLGGGFDLTLSGDTTDLTLGIAQLDPLLAGGGAVNLVAQRDETGTRIEDLRVQTPELRLEATADITSTSVMARIDARIEDLALVAEGLSGPATVTGTAQTGEDGQTAVDLDAMAAGARLDIKGIIAAAEADYATRGTIAASVADLAAWSGLAGRPLNGAAELNIAGTVLPLSGGFDLTVEGSTQDLALGIMQLDPLLAGSGDLAIAARRGPEGVEISQFRINTDELRAEGNADLTGAGAMAEFDARISDLNLIAPELSGPATLTGTAERLADGSTDLVVEAIAGTARLDIDALIAPEDQDFATQGTISAQITDLAPWSDLAGRPLNGAAELEIKGTVQPLSRWFDLTATGTTRDLALGIPQLDPLLQGMGAIALTAERGPEGIKISELRLETPQLMAEGVADTTGAGISARINARLTDIGLIVDGLNGPATLAGTAMQNPDGTTDVALTATTPNARIGANGVLGSKTAGYPFTGEVEAVLSDLAPYGALIGRDLSGSVALTATGTLYPSGEAFDLRLDGSTTDLGLGIPQLDPLLRGAGEIALTARRGPEGIEIPELRLNTPQLTAEGTADAKGEGISARINARLTDIGLIVDGLNGPATLTGTATQNPDGTTDLALTATTPNARIGAEGMLGPRQSGYPFTGEIEAQVSDLAPYAGLAGVPLSGSVNVTAQGTVQPLAPAFDLDLRAQTRNLGIGTPAVDRLLGGSGTLSAHVQLTETGNLRVQDLQLSTPNLTGTATLAGAGTTAEAEFDLRLRDIGIFTPDFSGPISAAGKAALTSAGQWRLDTRITGPGATMARVEGLVGAGGTLDLEATGTLPLGLLNGMLEPRRLEGLARFDLALKGPPALSSLSGSVTVDGARLSAPSLGQALENIAGGARIQNGRAQLNLSANLAGGGAVTLAGPITLQPPFPADLTVTLADLVLRDPKLYETLANGTVTINGPLTGGARIGGTIDLGETELRVPSSGIGGLGQLIDVTHFVPPPEVRRTLERAEINEAGNGAEPPGNRSGPVYMLDLLIRAPNQIFIRGRGLDAELGGQLRLTGTTREVDPVGRFDLIRGRLEILQQRFELTEGYAQLQGNFTPYIHLQATTEARDGTVVAVVVEGPLNNPEVSFTSSPDLPEDEVLARLIFGRDLASITPFQAVQLASAVGTLAGRGGGLVDDLREGLGLDDFDITSTEEGNAALRLGRYLGENLYTDVTIDSEGETEVNLNLDITRDIKAKASFDSEGKSRIGLFFERDY